MKSSTGHTSGVKKRPTHIAVGMPVGACIRFSAWNLLQFFNGKPVVAVCKLKVHTLDDVHCTV